MRWATIGLVGLIAGIVTWRFDPLFTPVLADDPTDLTMYVSAWYSVFTLAVWGLFAVGVVGGTIAAFRALWWSTRRAELASLIALGRDRHSLIRDQVRAGRGDGLIASAAVLVFAAAKQLATGVTGVEFSPVVPVLYALLMISVVACFVGAYWVAAVWATRGSVREVASGQGADAWASTRTRGQSHTRRRVWLWAARGVVIAVSLVVVFGTWDINIDNTSAPVARVLLIVAALFLAAVFYLGLPAMLISAGATLAVRVSRMLGGAMAAESAPGSMRSLTADSLARPIPLRTVAAAAVTAVMGVAAALTVVSFASAERESAAADLVPAVSVSVIDLMPSDTGLVDLTPGWSEPLPPDVLAALHADPALTVVEAAVLISDEYVVEDPEGPAFNYETRSQLLAVDPDALDEVQPGAWQRFYLTENTYWSGTRLGRFSGFDDNPHIAVNGERTEVRGVHYNLPWASISRTWADEVWGAGPTTAVLLYPAGEHTVEAALQAHNLHGLHVDPHHSRYDWVRPASAPFMAAVTAPFLAIAVCIVIGLAWSSQRLRARDQATLLALGATPGALRGAVALESGVLALVAGTFGLVGGSVAGTVFAELNNSPRLPVTHELVLHNLGQNLTTLPWAVLIALVVSAAALAATGAALIRVRVDRLSPSQQLTEAHKVGVS